MGFMKSSGTLKEQFHDSSPTLAGPKICRDPGKKYFSLIMAAAKVCAKKRMFPDVAQTTVGWLVCCGVGIVKCLFNLL